MVTLLRHFRRSLLNSGATRKYILYALGEFVLIVAGILVAMEINNWNNNRLERIQEENVVRAIYDEAGENLAYIKGRREYYRQRTERNGLHLLQMMGKAPTPISDDSLIYYISETIDEPAYTPHIAIFSNTMNNDDFNLIESDSLKFLLNRYQLYLERSNYNVENRQNTWQRFNTYYNEKIGGRHLALTLRESKPNAFKGISKSEFGIDTQELLSDKTFEALIANYLQIHYFHDNNLGRIVERIEQLRSHIRRHYEIE